MFDVRWIKSHKTALEQIFKQYGLLVKHMLFVKDNKDDFGQKAVTKVEDLLSMFGSRSTPLFMVYNLGKRIKYFLESSFKKYFFTDIQEEFAIQSLRFQSNDQSSMAKFICFFFRKRNYLKILFLSYWTIWLKGSFAWVCGSHGCT